ncbi:hypothetical protein [Paenibacillus sp. GSMTC-2017]|uniref:hypothetical protein n=1 Tax=Paenibacillus sp. GSMTC-2017 TaxID=2794350 RepID=UPI001E52055E|nr:hypothetical protein [Paenibacillus sp. GSMTC-2017]
MKPDFSKRYMLILGYNEEIDFYVSPVVPNHIELNDEQIATLKYNTDAFGTDENDKGDQMFFSVESLDLQEDEDRITGLSKELFKQFRAEIAKKKQVK